MIALVVRFRKSGLMARKIRIEYAGARYHLINRGNYRFWIFETEGARKSFLKCLEKNMENWTCRFLTLLPSAAICILFPREVKSSKGIFWSVRRGSPMCDNFRH